MRHRNEEQDCRIGTLVTQDTTVARSQHRYRIVFTTPNLFQLFRLTNYKRSSDVNDITCPQAKYKHDLDIRNELGLHQNQSKFSNLANSTKPELSGINKKQSNFQIDFFKFDYNAYRMYDDNYWGSLFGFPSFNHCYKFLRCHSLRPD